MCNRNATTVALGASAPVTACRRANNTRTARATAHAEPGRGATSSPAVGASSRAACEDFSLCPNLSAGRGGKGGGER